MFAYSSFVRRVVVGRPLSAVRSLLATAFLLGITLLATSAIAAPSPRTLGTCDTAGPIEVEATAGVDPGPTAYATLKLAFDAINLGTHQGTINIEVCGDTTETAAAVINASGAGSSVYTTIAIRPVGGSARTISGALATPLIDFNGADNVTIDGLNTGGNALTISNTNTSATPGTSTIRFINGATTNTVTNSNILGSATGAVTVAAGTILFSTDAATVNGNDNNTISNSNIGPAGANLPTKAINGIGSTTTTAIGNSGNIISSNNIFDFFGAAVSSSGVYVADGCNTWSITNNRFYQTGTRTWTTGAQNSPIWLVGTSATSGSQGFTITGNTIGYASNTQTGTYTLTGAGASAKFIGILFNGPSAGTTTNVNNNTIAAVSLAGVTASGTSTSSPFAAILFVEGNAVTSGNTIGSQAATGSLVFSTTTTSATDAYGIYNFSSNAWTANTNNIGGISVTNAGASGTFVLYGLRANTGTTATWNATGNNVGGTIANSLQLTATGTSSQLIGMHTSNAPASWTSNNIRNLTTNIGTGITTGASVIGMNITTTTPNHSVSQNTVSNLTNTSAAAASSVIGMIFTGGTSNTLSRNLVYGLSVASNSATALVDGILITGGTTDNVFNNIVGNLTTPAAANGTATSSSIRGIAITSTSTTTTLNLSFNTIYLNASSTGANFGTTGLFHTTSTVATTATLNLRDNVIVNTSTAAGTGLTVAYRRSSGAASALANYGSASNNNDFYAGTPGVANLIYADGTSSAQTIAAYKGGAFTAGTIAPRDSASLSENPPFLSTTGSSANFLHIDPTVATQLESGGITVSGITDDFDGQTRNVSTPDMGADEFTGILLDLAPPGISYSALGNTASTANRTLTTTITDATGVPTAGAGLPVIYYRKGASDPFVSTQGSFVSGNTYTFTLNYSLVTGGSVTVGDTIQYYVVAQDTAPTPNVGANPSAGASGFSANPPAASTPPTTPNSYMILGSIAGTFTVGAAGAYPTLTAAVNDLNSKVLTGPVVLTLLDASNTNAPENTGEVFPIVINANGGSSATNTITIKPATGVTAAITGAATGALIKVNGASYVTIDGSNSGGTDRSLTIENTSVTSPSVILFGSVGSTPITNGTLKNCIIRNGANSSSAVVISDAGTLGNAGVFSNITIDNNDVQKAFVGVFATGGTIPQGGSNLVYTGNTVNTSGANAIRQVGLYMQGVNGATVSQNTLGNFSGTEAENDTGIWLATGTINATISGNTVSNLNCTNATGGPIGINVTPAVTGNANITISQNSVSNLTTLGGTNMFGIVAGSTSGDAITVDRNTVQNIQNNNTGTFGAHGIFVNGGNNHVVKNNVVSNVNHNMTGGAAFSTTFGVSGINVQSGTGHKVYNNSVNLFGLMPGTATTSLLSAAFVINSTASTGMDVRNNIFANNITGGTTSIANVSVFLASAGTSAMNLTWNNNAYYNGTDAARQGIAQVGTTAGTTFFLTSNFNPAATTPSNNFRSYSSTLSTAGTNDNASIAFTTAVPFVSANDLHLQPLSAPESAGTPIASVTNDFDGDPRPATKPDIGADELVSNLTITPTSVLFGNQAVGSTSAEMTVTLANTGAGSLDVTTLDAALAPFARTGTGDCSATLPITIAPGAMCTLTYTFAPTSTGAANQTLTVTANGPGSGTIALSGTGTQGHLTISPASVPFGNQLVGTTSTDMTVTLGNDGNASLNVTALDAATAPFALTGGTCSSVPFAIAASDSCTLTYTFTPTATGSATQTITVTTDVPPVIEIPGNTFGLSGNGIQGNLTISPTTVPFGNQTVGTTSGPQAVTLGNNGSASLNVTALDAATAPFSRIGGNCSGSLPITIAAGNSCTVSYQFAPVSAGPFNQTLNVTANAPGSGTIGLSGTGVSADVSVSGGNLTITDSTGANNDMLTITLNGANVRISDPSRTLAAGSGATQIDPNTIEVPLASITGTITIDTLGGNDTLTLNLAGGNFFPAGGITFNGGNPTVAPGDKLVITGGSQGTVTYTYTNAHDGSIVMSNFGTVNYTGLEPITNSGTAADIVFNLPAGPTNDATLADDGTAANTISRLSAATIETTDFANPTGSVTINRGNATDTLVANALPDLTSSLTMGSGANPFAALEFNGAITLASGKNLSGDAATGTIALPNAIRLAAGSNFTASGAGTITLTSARNIVFATSTSITTVDGALTLNANQQVGATAGTFAGIDINGATVQALGTGLVTVYGKGGTIGAGNVGVHVFAGGIIRGGSNGVGVMTTDVFGTGGSGGTNPHGLFLDGGGVVGGADITSFGGDVRARGTSGNSTSTNNYGLFPFNQGRVTSGGNGNVVAIGTGGNLGNGNVGVFCHQGNGIITSGGTGTVTVTGTGGAGGASYGVQLFRDGRITSGGAGAVAVTGTGGPGSNSGVFVNGLDNNSPGARINSGGGSITVTGTGTGGTHGILLGGGGTNIVATVSNGPITLIGDLIGLDGTGINSVNSGSGATTLRQLTNAFAINLGGTDSVTQLGLDDGELDRVTAGTLNIGNASSGAVTVSAAISRSASTVMTVASGANIDIAGGSLDSGGGNVTLQPGTNVFASNSGVDVTTGAAATLGMTSGKDLKIVVNGTTADSGYTQLNVAGLVNVTGVNLAFSGSYTPVAGDAFTIVNNDAADAVTGTFAGLAEGASIANFLGSGLTAKITYIGGVGGNDVVVSIPLASTNADLSNLTLSAGTLAPPFVSGTIGYTASVPFATTSIMVTPTAADAGATITVNGTGVASGSPSGPISLSIGPNPISIVVTAADLTTMKTYTVTVTRAGLVDVTASAGTASGSYATLKGAFDKINDGTHQGTITVAISGNTTEGTTPATLNSSGAGSASYTSVVVNPTADGVSVSGNPAQGFGVIQLNGADNVTINGDNPNSAGTNRNLSVVNTATAATTFGSAIRVATSATLPYDSNNNLTIKNLILTGNVTGGNLSSITTTGSSSNSSFGIVVGPNGGAAITALGSVTTAVASGVTANGLLIDNNVVNACGRAISFLGNAATASTGVTISNNTIGDQGAVSPATPPYTSPATTVYTKGILVSGTAAITITGNALKNIMSYVGITTTAVELTATVTNSTISNNAITNVANNGTGSIVKAVLVTATTGAYSIAGNTITNVQALASSSGTDGLEVTAASTSGTIERNKIQTVYNRSTGTFGAYGLNLTAGTGIVIRNNFISDINMDMTGGGAFSTQFSVHGLRITGGTAHKVYHNSVNLFGSLLGTPTTAILTSAFTPTSVASMDVRNNIFSNTMSGGTTGVAHVSMFLPSSLTVSANLTINNNDYFSGAIAGQSGIAHVGTTYTSPPAGPATYAGLYTAANFNPADTVATTNLRTYTNTLSAAATNDNASLVVDPQFVSSTDLHIAVASPVVNQGVDVGVGSDIDGQFRVPPPDIGADEPSGITPPANDIAASTIVTPANASVLAVGAITTPQASFQNIGTAAQTNVMVQFTITGPGGYNYSNNQVIATINPNQSVTVTFAAAPAFTTAGSYNTTASVQTPDANAGNDMVAGTFQVVAPLAGAYNVPGDFASLTNAGGIFATLNVVGASGNVVINIAADLTGETGSNALNEIVGGFTVTIKPTGSARSITSTAGAISVIKLNDADGVTLDGSLSGGTDRSLTISNINSAASTAVIWIASATNGAQNNTIKNLNLSAGAAQNTGTAFTFGIISSSSAAITTGGTDNDNNTYRNNLIQRASVGIISIGGLAANMNQSTVIANNTVGPAAFGVDEIGTVGILIFNENLASVTGNEVRFVGDLAFSGGGSSRDRVGIVVGGTGASWSGTAAGPTVAVTNANVSGNLVHDIVEQGTFSAVGIVENASNAGSPTTNTIANNMIYNVLANGTSPDQAVGIGISNGNGDTIANNSVLLTGDIDPTGATSADVSSFGISVNNTGVLNLSLKNNISVMDLNSNTAALAKAAINVPAAFAWGTGGSNFNDWYAPAANTQSRVGATGGSGGTFYATLALWQAATTQDAASISSDPLFVGAANLHLQAPPALSPAESAGTPIAGITVDFDNDPRPATKPDIGADELVSNLTITPTMVAFGNLAINTTSGEMTVTLANTGTGSLDVTTLTTPAIPFARTMTGSCSASLPITIASGASCTLTYTFAPTALVMSNQTLTVTSNGPGSGTIDLSGTGAQGMLTIAPTALLFGNQIVGVASGEMTVTLGNSGTASLQVTALDAAVAPFALTGSGSCSAVPITIVASGSCTLTYTFTPAATGPFSQTLNVTANAPGSGTIDLSGTGIQGNLTISPTTVPFGNQTVGTTSGPTAVTLGNNGTASLDVTALTAAAAPFSRIGGNCSGTLPITIPAGGSCTVSYQFAPTATGPFNQTLTVTANAPGSGTIDLSGTGIQGNLVVSPTTVDFDSPDVGTVTPEGTVTLSNTGNASLDVTALTLASAPFVRTVTGTCGNSLPITIPASGSCTLTYTFNPTVAGVQNQVFTVTANAPGTGSMFTLTGEGVGDRIFRDGFNP